MTITMNRRVYIKTLIRLMLLTLCLTCLHWKAYAADTIKVLILNDVYSKIPQKTERMEKIGSMKGDLMVMGLRFGGDVDLWKGENGLYIINELPLEEYVRGVVAEEMRADWDMEALKAQAVISRTYAVYQRSVNCNSFYNVVSSVLNQAYKGENSDVRVTYAVTETTGEILTYKGKPIEAFYHSTTCGMTENPEDVFGKSYPYLKPVKSNCGQSPYSTWSRKITLEEIEKALGIRSIKGISIKSFTSTKRVKQLNIKTSSGAVAVNATDLRKALGWSRLPSTSFTVSRHGASILFEGSGYGHGVGLCQWSALEMAREGKDYREILSFFYPGTILELYESR
jgi:stage II sporulation protein D